MLNMIPDMRTDNRFNRSRSMRWQQVPDNLEPSAGSSNDKTNMHTHTRSLKCRGAMEKAL